MDENERPGKVGSSPSTVESTPVNQSVRMRSELSVSRVCEGVSRKATCTSSVTDVVGKAVNVMPLHTVKTVTPTDTAGRDAIWFCMLTSTAVIRANKVKSISHTKDGLTLRFVISV
eukprot:TRINITY_DN15385_c0_g1::TRINITY_DN15385_c0_g1_i1::g.22705::m.22705 TRINITY_DN15385_c0_g1::TRINITY_DN15385_c0_g1_i1::g.22705  ORF type:complete len:116 (+),score=-3.90,RAP-1/PF03085.10/0.18 TRINITY_DN15385_c0_g1_i1:1033-1380(+)